MRAKTELARSLPADGVAIVDADGYSDFASVDWPAKTIRVSAQPELGADVLVGDIAVSGAGTTFSMTRRGDGERLEMTTKLLGRHAAFNSALAVVAGLELGIDPIGIRSGLSLLKPVSHRLEIVRNDSVVVIDDAFSSNPDGFAAALEVLGSFPGRRILITPGMIELGDQTVSAHIAAAKLAAQTCDIAIVVGRAAPPEFAQTLRDAGFGETKLFIAASLAEATEMLGHLLQSRRRGAVRERPARQLRVVGLGAVSRALAVSFAQRRKSTTRARRVLAARPRERLCVASGRRSSRRILWSMRWRQLWARLL